MRKGNYPSLPRTAQVVAKGPALSPQDIADATEARATAYLDPARFAPDGVVVIDGYGAHLKVEKGSLRISDGVGAHRRERSFSRAQAPSAVVVQAHGGSVSLDAIKWLTGLGVPLTFCSPNAERVLLASPPQRPVDAALLRAQLRAKDDETGIELCRQVLTQKVEGQAQVADQLLDARKIAKQLYGLAEEIAFAPDMKTGLDAESEAGRIYWPVWQGLAPRFRVRDRSRVPEHWQQGFVRRGSSIGGVGNRYADDPVSALLHIGYRLAEISLTRAVRSVGLSPEIGAWHTDEVGRASFSLDLLEALRPRIDAFVVSVLRGHEFAKVDFVEDETGTIRLALAKSHDFITTVSPAAARWAAPVAELARHVVERGTSGARYRGAMPLSGRRRRESTAKRLGREAKGELTTTLGGACRWCNSITRPDAKECPRCGPRPVTRQQHQTQTPKAATCNRCGVELPAPDGRRRSQRRFCDACVSAARGEAISKARSARAAFERAGNEVSPKYRRWFVEQVQPELVNVPTGRLAERCGVSPWTASKWRRAALTPSPMYWPVLAEVVGASLPTDAEVHDLGAEAMRREKVAHDVEVIAAHEAEARAVSEARPVEPTELHKKPGA
jgi:CRISPR-associated endonuclease Cas1